MKTNIFEKSLIHQLDEIKNLINEFGINYVVKNRLSQILASISNVDTAKISSDKELQNFIMNARINSDKIFEDVMPLPV